MQDDDKPLAFGSLAKPGRVAAAAEAKPKPAAAIFDAPEDDRDRCVPLSSCSICAVPSTSQHQHCIACPTPASYQPAAHGPQVALSCSQTKRTDRGSNTDVAQWGCQRASIHCGVLRAQLCRKKRRAGDVGAGRPKSKLEAVMESDQRAKAAKQARQQQSEARKGR